MLHAHGKKPKTRRYRKMAMRWHPDKNHGDAEAAEKFQYISEAYAALNDRTSAALCVYAAVYAAASRFHYWCGCNG